MKKTFLVCIILISLHSTYQLNCGTYDNYPNCGFHNTNYQLTCHKFSTDCEEVEVDEGCEINSSNQCIKTNSVPADEDCINFYYGIYPNYDHICKRVKINADCKIDNYQCKDKASLTNEKCSFSDDYKNCQKYPKVCSDYSDSSCGNIGIKENTQCFKPQTGNCAEVKIDENCKMKEGSNYECEKRVDFDETLYQCVYSPYTKECKKTEIKCKDRTDTTKCKTFGCYKIDVNGYRDSCHDAVVDSECTINDDGECTEKENTDTDIKQCAFNQTYYDSYSPYPIGCKVTTKSCSQITKTSKCSSGLTSKDYSCKKVDGETNCKEVKIHSSCNVNDEGKCVVKSGITDKTCKFNSAKTKCYLYDNKCQLDNDDNCSIIPSEDSQGKKTCAFEDTENMYCKIRDKICEDYTTKNDCEGDTSLGVENTKKCSWSYPYHSSGKYCKEYGIDAKCTVTNGNCKNTTITEKVCLFDLNGYQCSEKEKKCANYHEDCYTDFPVKDNDETQTSQCFKYADNEYCRIITIDKYCKVDDNTHQCVPRVSFEEKEGICSFDENKSKCSRVPRKCNKFTKQNTCDDATNCNWDTYFGACFEIDDYCKMDSGNCKEKDSSNKQAGKKCAIDVSKKECKKDDMICEDYDKDKCKEIQYPQSENKQCIKYDDKCVEVKLDGNCKVNETYSCVPVDSSKISDHEVCDFDGYYDLRCEKREKVCKDVPNNQCEQYKPTTKLCFNIDSNGCEEVRVDSQCKMNEDNECTGKGCSLKEDDDKIYHCSYKGDSSFVQLKRFLLLVLILIF